MKILVFMEERLREKLLLRISYITLVAAVQN